MQANNGDPDQMLLSAASDLVLHCPPVSHKKDARLIWVKVIPLLQTNKTDMITGVSSSFLNKCLHRIL